MNIEGFKLLCEPTMKDLYKWLSAEMLAYYGKDNVIVDGDYLFCIGNIGTMLCAHLDTVHKEQPEKFVEKDGVLSSPQGIGGDDRCGVYSILSVLKELKGKNQKPYLFFSTDEEVGGASTKKAAKDLKNIVGDVNYLIELDRMNKNDSVYYKCDNKEFKKFIDKHGFVEAQGSFTDICTLCSAWDLAGVNLSVGNYKQHTLLEYVVVKEVDETISKVVEIIENSDPQKRYEFCEKKTYTPAVYNKNRYEKDFKVGDRVYVGFQALAKVSPSHTAKSVFSVSVDDTLEVIKVNGDFCLVEICDFGGAQGWISSYSLFLCR